MYMFLKDSVYPTEPYTAEELAERGLPSAFGVPTRPVGFPALGPLLFLWPDVEHFQPGHVLLGCMADQVRTFYPAFRRITFGEID